MGMQNISKKESKYEDLLDNLAARRFEESGQLGGIPAAAAVAALMAGRQSKDVQSAMLMPRTNKQLIKNSPSFASENHRSVVFGLQLELGDQLERTEHRKQVTTL